MARLPTGWKRSVTNNTRVITTTDEIARGCRLHSIGDERYIM